jgi:hypothetical protein
MGIGQVPVQDKDKDKDKELGLLPVCLLEPHFSPKAITYV